MKNKPNYLAAVFLLTLMVGCAGGSNSSQSSPAAAPQVEESTAEYEADMSEPAEDNGGSSANQPRKVIIEARMELETKNFDKDTAAIKNIVSDGKSYFENTSLSVDIYNDKEYRVFYGTLRVPAEEYERVKEFLKSVGNLTRLNESTEDATNRYYDSQTRLETKKIEESRVLDLIEKAETIEEILELERQLSDIRLEIEMHSDNITKIDRQTAYSTVHLEVREVNDYSLRYLPEDFGSRILDGLNKSYRGTVSFAQGFVILLAGLIIPAVIIMALGAVVFATMIGLNKLKNRHKT